MVLLAFACVCAIRLCFCAAANNFLALSLCHNAKCTTLHYNIVLYFCLVRLKNTCCASLPRRPLQQQTKSADFSLFIAKLASCNLQVCVRSFIRSLACFAPDSFCASLARNCRIGASFFSSRDCQL